MPNEYDLGRMQEEAIRRAREMQSRARAATQRSSPGQRRQESRPSERQQPSPAPPEQTPPEPESEPRQSIPPQNLEPDREDNPVAPAGSILDSLFQDKERTVILALLILLSGDGDHHELMFALLFLLM